MNIALIGHGSMGTAVEVLAREKGHSISVVLSKHHDHLRPERLGDTLRIANVAIDFTSAAAVKRNVEACVMAGIPLVIGTTGWLEEKNDIENIVVKGDGSVIYGANFSIGVNLFYRIARYAAELFANFPEYEAFIEEQHHSRKKDAPSGTAIKLKEVVSEYMGGDLNVASTRAGHIPGTHRLGFDSLPDQVLLEHTARSRESFAAGALWAAEWIIGKKGFFDFADVIDGVIQAGGDR